jgi:hypothetical protein
MGRPPCHFLFSPAFVYFASLSSQFLAYLKVSVVTNIQTIGPINFVIISTCITRAHIPFETKSNNNQVILSLISNDPPPASMVRLLRRYRASAEGGATVFLLLSSNQPVSIVAV